MAPDKASTAPEEILAEQRLPDKNKIALRRTLIGRIFRSLVVGFWVMFIAFSLLRFSPGDPIRNALGTDATEEAVAALREVYGLDRPFFIQFWNYFTGVFQGDFGVSFFSSRDVSEVISTHLPVTLMIILLSILGAVTLAVPIALSVALSRRPGVTYFFRTATSISLALPGFFLALIGLLYFGTVLNWAPAAGYEGNFPGNLKYLWLPALVNCFSLVPILSRVLHSSLMDTLDEEYVETGVIRGVRKLRFYWSYMLRPSLAPTVVLLSYMIGVMIGGTVVMETIFSLPGIGRELIQAVDTRDYAVVQSIVMVFGLIVVFVSFIGDLLGYLLDRRVTLS
ncbi:MAG: ABC transporter permease [Actinobacteria bacterium]|nr:ABC transporter permease [Actinomycetota bacterium]